jgi:hypothetical protein
LGDEFQTALPRAQNQSVPRSESKEPNARPAGLGAEWSGEAYSIVAYGDDGELAGAEVDDAARRTEV